MAEALYRKYRPQVFDDVVGQDHIERTLKSAIDQDKVSHAYLFCGPRGTGKTTTARLLAKALLCEDGPTSSPDGTCRSCQEVASGTHPDVYELDAASRTGVENVRDEIIGRVNFAPTRGKSKVYIIDEVHMLSTAAFNALLKTLEEPPSHVVFILCTTDPQKVPETIHSRCQRFDFHRLSNEQIVSRLGAICMEEGVDFEGAALDLVAHRAEGGMRNALTTLEQLIAFGEGHVTVRGAEDLLGSLDSTDMAEIVNAVGRRDVAACFDWVQSYVESGADLAQFCTDFAQRVRNLYVMSLAGSDIELDVPEAERQEMAAELRYFGPERLARLLGVLGDVLAQLRSANNPRLCFEVALTRMVRPESDVTIEALFERVEALERIVAGGVAGALPASVASVPAGESPASAAAAAAMAASEAAVQAAHGVAAKAAHAAADTPLQPEAAPAPEFDPERVQQTLAQAAAREAARGAAREGLAGGATAGPVAASAAGATSAASATGGARQPGAAAAAGGASGASPQFAAASDAGQAAAPATSSDASTSAAPAASGDEPAAAAAASAAPSAELAALLSNAPALQRTWRQAVGAVKREKPAYGVLFVSAQVRDGGGTLAIDFPADNPFAFNMVQKPEVKEVLARALAQAAGFDVPFVICSAGLTAGGAVDAAAESGGTGNPSADALSPRKSLSRDASHPYGHATGASGGAGPSPLGSAAGPQHSPDSPSLASAGPGASDIRPSAGYGGPVAKQQAVAETAPAADSFSGATPMPASDPDAQLVSYDDVPYDEPPVDAYDSYPAYDTPSNSEPAPTPSAQPAARPEPASADTQELGTMLSDAFGAPISFEEV